MSAHLRSAQLSSADAGRGVACAIPARRGICPGLSQPLSTGDGLLVRLLPTATIALDAFAALCAAARAHGNGIVEITARGNIQVRGLSALSTPRFAAAIAALGIAVEDGVPILCNPLAGLDAAEAFDATALAAALRHTLARQSLTARLDPKVSVTIDDGAPLGLARVAADIRLRGQRLNGELALRLSVGGDESAARDLGFIAVGDGIEATSRLLGVLAARGRSARARDIVAAEGSAPFDAALVSLRTDQHAAAGLDHFAAPRQCKDAIGAHDLRDGSLAHGIGLAFGHAEASTLEKLVDAAAAAGARGLRTAPDRSLLVIGLTKDRVARLSTAAEQLGFVTHADDPRRRVFACAGAPLCASAYIAARALAPRIAEAAAPYLSDGITVHISGCTKGCAHSTAASLTVVGTAGDCVLIADGSVRDTPFAAVPPQHLPQRIADHLRDRSSAAEGSPHA
jgi:precorrin-3B synthase